MGQTSVGMGPVSLGDLWKMRRFRLHYDGRRAAAGYPGDRWLLSLIAGRSFAGRRFDLSDAPHRPLES